jgi:hypothetical protein
MRTCPGRTSTDDSWISIRHPDVLGARGFTHVFDARWPGMTSQCVWTRIAFAFAPRSAARAPE